MYLLWQSMNGPRQRACGVIAAAVYVAILGVVYRRLTRYCEPLDQQVVQRSCTRWEEPAFARIDLKIYLGSDQGQLALSQLAPIQDHDPCTCAFVPWDDPNALPLVLVRRAECNCTSLSRIRDILQPPFPAVIRGVVLQWMDRYTVADSTTSEPFAERTYIETRGQLRGLTWIWDALDHPQWMLRDVSEEDVRRIRVNRSTATNVDCWIDFRGRGTEQGEVLRLSREDPLWYCHDRLRFMANAALLVLIVAGLVACGLYSLSQHEPAQVSHVGDGDSVGKVALGACLVGTGLYLLSSSDRKPLSR
jgi:hypothetical protein